MVLVEGRGQGARLPCLALLSGLLCATFLSVTASARQWSTRHVLDRLLVLAGSGVLNGGFESELIMG